MLNVAVICVGKLKESYLREACTEYVKRLGAFCKLTIIEVEEARLPDHPSAAQIAACVENEGKRIIEKLHAGTVVIPLCIEGEQLDSTGFSREITGLAGEGASRLAFIIGGSHGLCDDLKTRAKRRLSMSRMTFPHQLARVLLLEQLYRAFQIAANGKYHK